MGFYEEISKYYDYIFPTGKGQLEFIKDAAGQPPKKVLDVACGTGGYSMALASAGYDVTAVDLDGKMVEEAKAKAQREGLPVEVLKCDMLNLARTLEDDFDCIFCIGNSLVHLTTMASVSEALEQMGKRLAWDGSLVLQIINFDRILKYNIDSLPSIKNENPALEFIRNYDYDSSSGLIRFNTILKVEEAGGGRYENSVELLPLQSGELRGIFEKSGFSRVEFFGDFSGSAFSDTSFMLVARCGR